MKRIFSLVFILSLFGMLLTTSCNHTKTKQRLAQIDTLSILLDKTELMLNELNQDTIAAMLKNTSMMNKAITPFVHTKLNLKERSDYFQLAGIEKQFKNYQADHTKNLDELKYSRKQLADLKEDVDKHKIKDKKYDEYYQSENTSVNNLFNLVKSSLYKAKQNIERYNNFNPVITKMMADKKIKLDVEVSDKNKKEAEGGEDDD